MPHGPNPGSDDGVVPPPDERLLEAFVAGDDDALGQLAERHERAMLGLARGLLGDEQQAMEAVQDTWVRVIRGAASFRHQASVKTWMYAILTNQCRDIRSRERSRRRRERTRRVPEAGDTGRHLSARVIEAVAGLEEPGRETLILCYQSGMTHSQAAGVLGVPIGTIKSRLHKAMSRLREQLGVFYETEARS